MKNFFWIDEERHLYKTEREFIADLNKLTYVRKYNNEKNPYNMVVQLAAGMMHGLETYLLDPEWSSHELANMGLSDEKINEVYPLSSPGGTTSLGDLIGMVREQDWKMWLFTSGSTGIPKRVCHTFQTLARNVKKSDRHQRDCWAFAYKISHMAGIQVFLQAILNENSLVYVFESQPVQIIAAMQKYHCTRISATPRGRGLLFLSNMRIKSNFPLREKSLFIVHWQGSFYSKETGITHMTLLVKKTVYYIFNRVIQTLSMSVEIRSIWSRLSRQSYAWNPYRIVW